MKNKFLTWILNNNFDFFLQTFKKTLSDSFLKNAEKDDMISLYEQNKEFFEELLIKEFVGYIPTNVTEPALKIFEEHAELFQKWIMWQSYYINRKALHDPVHIPKYDGMMIYLRVLHLMAENNKKAKPITQTSVNQKVEQPWLDKALEGISEYKKLYEDSKTNPSAENEDNQDTGA